MKIADMQPVVLNGRWRLDELDNQLVDLQGSGAAVALAPIAVRLLAVLAASPNVVIGRRHLLDEGWRRYGFEVCENSLNQVICALRTAFERLGPGAPSIRTVPRIGYCFLAEVAGRENPAQASSSQAPAPVSPAWCEADDRRPFPVGQQALDGIAGYEWRRAQRNGLPLSVLMIGPDTRMGISGDAAAVASMIEGAIRGCTRRAGDAVVRYASLEYAVLLPDTDHQGAAHVARGIQQATHRENWRGQGSAPRVTLAVGLACTAQRRYATQDEWIEAARSALQGMLTGSPARATTLSCAA